MAFLFNGISTIARAISRAGFRIVTAFARYFNHETVILTTTTVVGGPVDIGNLSLHMEEGIPRGQRPILKNINIPSSVSNKSYIMSPNSPQVLTPASTKSDKEKKSKFTMEALGIIRTGEENGAQGNGSKKNGEKKEKAKEIFKISKSERVNFTVVL